MGSYASNARRRSRSSELAAQKVADETKRIEGIRNHKQLQPPWLEPALRAAGVIGEGETL